MNPAQTTNPARKWERGVKRIQRDTFTPVSKMTVPAWADRYRRLASSSGAMGGAWRTSRVEVARGPMLAVTEPGVRTITVKSCTQLMKTSLLENVIGRFAHLDPCPMLLTQPKEGAIRAFSKERLTPMARATPVLTALLTDRKHSGRRVADTTTQFKQFPGGFLALESAGSPTNLAMRAIRVTLLDEIDKYESTKEGDPVLLAEERTSTFKDNSLHLRVCSPTWAETSRIEKSYNESDMRRPYVACPHCNHEQVLDFFKHVEWPKSEDGEHFPFRAAIYCESCKTEWTEAQRLNIMTTKGAIKWRQTKPFICCDVRQEPMKTERWRWDKLRQLGMAVCQKCKKDSVPTMHAGFTASKLYSPFTTVPELASKWIESKDDPDAKQTFYNTQLGVAFEAQAMRKVEASGLSVRRENYEAEVPRGVLVLTAGVDVQPGSGAGDGRLEVEVVGWGLGEESWSVGTETFTGDPARPDLWNELDAYLLRHFAYEGGGEMAIRAVCIDSGGHNTQDVYSFARARVGRNIWATKGSADRGGQWSPVWPSPRVELKGKRTGYKPIMLGVNAAKEAIRQKLMIDQPGPGYCHFDMKWTDGRFAQLTAEQLIIERKGGFGFRKWILPRGRANEALDCRVYAYSALCGLYAVRRLNLNNQALLLEAARKTGGTQPPKNPDPAKTPAEKPQPVQDKKTGRRIHRSRFVG